MKHGANDSKLSPTKGYARLKAQSCLAAAIFIEPDLSCEHHVISLCALDLGSTTRTAEGLDSRVPPPRPMEAAGGDQCAGMEVERLSTLTRPL